MRRKYERILEEVKGERVSIRLYVCMKGYNDV